MINIRIRKKRKLSDPDPNKNNIINTNINLNEKKKSNKNIVNYGNNNNYSQIILEESNRIRTNIIKKYENNQLKKLRIFPEQIIKFVNGFKVIDIS